MRALWKRQVWLAAVGVLVLSSAQSSAAYTWKWTDDQGQVHITDNYPSIPSAFQSKAVQVDDAPGPKNSPAVPAAPTASPIVGATSPVPAPATTGGTRLRMTGEGSVEEIPESPGQATTAPAPTQPEGAQELERDQCGYTKRDWTLRVVPANQDLERAQAEAKRASAALEKSTGAKPSLRVKLRNDKKWADQKLSEVQKMVERTIPEDAQKCGTPAAWLRPPTR